MQRQEQHDQYERSKMEEDGDSSSIKRKYHHRSYPSSLWPLILTRSFNCLQPFSCAQFRIALGRKFKCDGLYDEYEGQHGIPKDEKWRRASVVYHLMLKGMVADLVMTHQHQGRENNKKRKYTT